MARYATRIRFNKLAVFDTLRGRMVRTFVKPAEALAHAQGLALYDALAVLLEHRGSREAWMQAAATLRDSTMFNDSAYDRSREPAIPEKTRRIA